MYGDSCIPELERIAKERLQRLMAASKVEAFVIVRKGVVYVVSVIVNDEQLCIEIVIERREIGEQLRFGSEEEYWNWLNND